MRAVKTDIFDDAVQSLNVAVEFATRAKTDDSAIKWLVIALHSILQDFMLIALRRSDGLGIHPEAYEKKLARAEKTGRDFPEERILDFCELFGRIKEPQRIQYSQAGHFISSVEIEKAMERLNSLRSDFIHFKPRAWSIILDGYPQSWLHCLSVAEFLINNSANFAHPKSGDLNERLKNLRNALQVLASETS